MSGYLARNQLMQDDPSMFGVLDPAAPDPRAAALTTSVNQLGDWLARQQQQAVDQGLWTGGQVWEGGHPTQAGMLDASKDLAQNFEGGIKAFHGSPHGFDAFDASKIGTGEGAQAYGHGLYFAENEGVAKSYRDALASENATINGVPVRDIAAQKYRMGMNETPTETHDIADFVSSYQNNARYMMEQRRPELLPAYDKMVADGTLKQGGHMYEVDINAEPEHFLDWDKPLSQQHPNVQKAIADTFAARGGGEQYLKNMVAAGHDTGGELHEALGRNQQQTTDALANAGIPGIRYLDAGSRAGGQGSHNYVVFNDKTIDLIRRYGLAGLIAGGAGSQLAQPATTDQQQ